MEIKEWAYFAFMANYKIFRTAVNDTKEARS
jgi:hypothetical protein